MKDYTVNRVIGLMNVYHKDTYMHMAQVSRLNILFGKFEGFSSKEIDNLYISGLLHDIGKLHISEEILNKPGKLTEEEFNIIKKHPKLGLEIIQKTDLRQYSSFRDTIENVVYTHHIWKGYPEDNGVEPNIYSKITSLSDCFQALTSIRAYKKAFSMERALSIMANEMSDNEFYSDFKKMIIQMY